MSYDLQSQSKRSLRFRVAARIYTLQVAAEPLYRGDEELLGVCDHTERRTLLAPDCPLQGRLEVAFHEIAHGWFHQLGIPIDEESAADQFAMMALALFEDLRQQGGVDAILSLGMDDDELEDAASIGIAGGCRMRLWHSDETELVTAGYEDRARRWVGQLDQLRDELDQLVMHGDCPAVIDSIKANLSNALESALYVHGEAVRSAMRAGVNDCERVEDVA